MPPAVEGVGQRLDSPIRELIASERLIGFDTTSAEQVIWALLRGLIAMQIAEPEHPWAPGLAERAVDTMLRGMTTSSAHAGGAPS